MTDTASEPSKLPDFVIVGAMKAGTSSMHSILAAHEDVFIPDSEIFFFDLDDPESHHDFQVAPDGSWNPRDFEENFDRNLEWYESFFEPADDDALIGEDSTTYLVSREAPERIARVLDEPKCIVMMRDPADRAYSHYWHLLRSGRATRSFEEYLRQMPHGLLKFGFYQDHLERYLEHFDRDDIKCVVFERFVEDNQQVVDEVCGFLGLEGTVAVDSVDMNKNAARVPRSSSMKQFFNKIDPTREDFRYTSHLPGPEVEESGVNPLRQARRFVHNIFDDASMVAAREDYPPMDEDTRTFLATLFRRRNSGLSEIVGRDLTKWWSIW